MGKSKLVLLVLLMAILGSCNIKKKENIMLAYSVSDIVDSVKTITRTDIYTEKEDTYYLKDKHTNFDVLYYIDEYNPNSKLCSHILVNYYNKKAHNNRIKYLAKKFSKLSKTDIKIPKTLNTERYLSANFGEGIEEERLIIEIGIDYIKYYFEDEYAFRRVFWNDDKTIQLQIWELLNN